mmetsp:Transcript_1467/g.3771  ORF Transcript_1467/g.3771 Transcript_1467/m.3771 type:complete len:254 (+) Transcript_1467:771-1532(+)
MQSMVSCGACCASFGGARSSTRATRRRCAGRSIGSLSSTRSPRLHSPRRCAASSCTSATICSLTRLRAPTDLWSWVSSAKRTCRASPPLSARGSRLPMSCRSTCTRRRGTRAPGTRALLPPSFAQLLVVCARVHSVGRWVSPPRVSVWASPGSIMRCASACASSNAASDSSLRGRPQPPQPFRVDPHAHGGSHIRWAYRGGALSPGITDDTIIVNGLVRKAHVAAANGKPACHLHRLERFTTRAWIHASTSDV